MFAMNTAIAKNSTVFGYFFSNATSVGFFVVTVSLMRIALYTNYIQSPNTFASGFLFWCGEKGIRTLGTLSSTPPFQGGTLDRSAISPTKRDYHARTDLRIDVIRS